MDTSSICHCKKELHGDIFFMDFQTFKKAFYKLFSIYFSPTPSAVNYTETQDDNIRLHQ